MTIAHRKPLHHVCQRWAFKPGLGVSQRRQPFIEASALFFTITPGYMQPGADCAQPHASPGPRVRLAGIHTSEVANRGRRRERRRSAIRASARVVVAFVSGWSICWRTVGGDFRALSRCRSLMLRSHRSGICAAPSSEIALRALAGTLSRASRSAHPGKTRSLPRAARRRAQSFDAEIPRDGTSRAAVRMLPCGGTADDRMDRRTSGSSTAHRSFRRRFSVESSPPHAQQFFADGQLNVGDEIGSSPI